jgi:uncharacterized protein YccT (UPF0319 family)
VLSYHSSIVAALAVVLPTTSFLPSIDYLAIDAKKPSNTLISRRHFNLSGPGQ